MTLAGFALVFVVCVWTLSALGGVALAMFGSQIARIGPLFERRLATIVAVVPPVLALAVTSALIVHSALGVDHCAVHDHHAHLCLTHGTRWLALPTAVAALSVAGVTVLARGLFVGLALVRGRRSIRLLLAASTAVDGIRLVSSDRAFCFVAGSAPAIYVSTRVWSTLSSEQRAALVAHETAHIEHGDLRIRLWMEMWLLFAAPLVGERTRSSWLAASERLCDAHAARESSPEAVASTMVSLFRLETTRPAGSFGLTPSQTELGERVEAVLAAHPLGNRVAMLAGRLALITCVALIAAAAIVAEPLHHAFETLLG